MEIESYFLSKTLFVFVNCKTEFCSIELCFFNIYLTTVILNYLESKGVRVSEL